MGVRQEGMRGTGNTGRGKGQSASLPRRSLTCACACTAGKLSAVSAYNPDSTGCGIAFGRPSSGAAAASSSSGGKMQSKVRGGRTYGMRETRGRGRERRRKTGWVARSQGPKNGHDGERYGNRTCGRSRRSLVCTKIVCAKEFKPSARPSTGLMTAPTAPMATPRTKPVDPCFKAPSTGLVITPVTPAATPEMTAPPPSTIPEMTPSRAASCATGRGRGVCMCVMRDGEQSGGRG